MPVLAPKVPSDFLLLLALALSLWLLVKGVDVRRLPDPLG